MSYIFGGPSSYPQTPPPLNAQPCLTIPDRMVLERLAAAIEKLAAALERAGRQDND